MSHVVWPTSKNVTDTSDSGVRFREMYITQQMNHSSGHRGGVLHGFPVSNPSGLTVQFGEGQAIVYGHRVKLAGTDTCTATDNATSYQHLKLNLTGSRATSAEIVSLSAPSLYPYYVLLSKTVASSGTITTLDDERQFIRSTRGDTYTGDGTTNRHIQTPFGTSPYRTPALVMGSTADGTSTDRIFCISEINAPGNKLDLNDRFARARIWFEPKEGPKIARFKDTTVEVVDAGITSLDGGDYYICAEDEFFCSGARIGDFVLVNFDPGYAGTYYPYINAWVHAADTVKIIVKAATSAVLNHKVTITIISMAETFGDFGYWNDDSEMHFLSGADQTTDKSPLVDVDGFVTSGGTSQSMNASGREYNYVSFFG